MSSCYPHSNSLCSHRTNELLPSVTAHTWTVLNQQWEQNSHCISCTELQVGFLTGLWMHYSVLCRIHLFEISDLGLLIQRLEVEWWHDLCLLNCALHRGVLRTCSSLTIILNNSSQGLILGSLLSLLLVYIKNNPVPSASFLRLPGTHPAATRKAALYRSQYSGNHLIHIYSHVTFGFSTHISIKFGFYVKSCSPWK